MVFFHKEGCCCCCCYNNLESQLPHPPKITTHFLLGGPPPKPKPTKGTTRGGVVLDTHFCRQNKIAVEHLGESYNFNFDRVFDGSSTQEVDEGQFGEVVAVYGTKKSYPNSDLSSRVLIGFCGSFGRSWLFFSDLVGLQVPGIDRRLVEPL